MFLQFLCILNFSSCIFTLSSCTHSITVTISALSTAEWESERESDHEQWQWRDERECSLQRPLCRSSATVVVDECEIATD